MPKLRRTERGAEHEFRRTAARYKKKTATSIQGASGTPRPEITCALQERDARNSTRNNTIFSDPAPLETHPNKDPTQNTLHTTTSLMIFQTPPSACWNSAGRVICEINEGHVSRSSVGTTEQWKANGSHARRRLSNWRPQITCA